jgi:pyruvate dehydrogenase E1 component beta subunit
MQCGIKVLMPATPRDAKALFTAAIREDDPVVLFAPSAVMGSRGAVPEEDICMPLGRGEIRRHGTDVTVIASAPLLADAMRVAEALFNAGVSVEILDPRSLLPFDYALLEESVLKTGRLVIFDDSNRTCGFASELAAYTAEKLFQYLRSPVIRITRADLPVPFSTALDKHVLPRPEQLERAIRQIMEFQNVSQVIGAGREVQ